MYNVHYVITNYHYALAGLLHIIAHVSIITIHKILILNEFSVHLMCREDEKCVECPQMVGNGLAAPPQELHFRFTYQVDKSGLSESPLCNISCDRG